MAFEYRTISEDTTFVPIACAIAKDGVPLSETGVTVTVTVKDRDLKDPVTKERIPIVIDAPATAHPSIVGRWEYWFSPEQVADIVGQRVWLVEWKVSVGEYTFRSPEPATLVIKRKLT